VKLKRSIRERELKTICFLPRFFLLVISFCITFRTFKVSVEAMAKYRIERIELIDFKSNWLLKWNFSHSTIPPFSIKHLQSFRSVWNSGFNNHLACSYRPKIPPQIYPTNLKVHWFLFFPVSIILGVSMVRIFLHLSRQNCLFAETIGELRFIQRKAAILIKNSFFWWSDFFSGKGKAFHLHDILCSKSGLA